MSSTARVTDNVFLNRNYRLVFLGALVSELGAILYSFTVSFHILKTTGNDAMLQGLYLALCGATMLAFTLVGGVLGDRMSKAKIMYVCDFLKGGMIVLATALMLVFTSPEAQLAILFALGIVGNMASGVFTPAAGSLLPHIVQEDQLQQANAYFTMKGALESVLGIILAGVLYAALPIHALFFLVGLCYIVSGISETKIRYEHQPSSERLTLKVAISDMADGVAYLRTKRAILVMLVAVLFVNFFITPVMGNFLPFFVRTSLVEAPSYLLDGVLTPELWSSVAQVCFGASSLLGAAVLSGRAQLDRCGRKIARLLCVMAVVVIGLTVCYLFFVDLGSQVSAFLVALCLGFLAMGFLVASINVPASTVLMRVVDRDKLSKVNSLTNVGSQGMVPIASVLAGVILGAFGSTALLGFCSLGFAVTAIALLVNPQIDML